MPFQPHHHQHSVSDAGQGGTHDNFYSAANALYQSGQTLASAGTPNNNAWAANNNPPAQQHPQPGHGYHSHTYSNGSISRQSSLRYAPPQYHHQHQQQQQGGIPSSPAAQLSPRRPNFQNPPMSDHYGAPPAYGNNDVNLQIQPPTPGHPPASVPGALQAGQSRGLPSQAPQLPPLPQISTQLQQPPPSSLSARPTVSTSHSYSKSSPGNMDPGTPKYKAFSNTPDTQKYMSPASSHAPPSSAFGPQSYSPLGLADIRPRTEADLLQTHLSPGGPVLEEPIQHPTNSNYLAPWPIFAVDWCKWPPKTNVSQGKIAIGSYLEDNHNYIQILDAQKTQIDPENPQGERGMDFVKTAEANHAYPVTRILWEPPSSNKQSTDLLATSGDHLRLWSLPSETSSYSSNNITRQGSKDNQPLQKLSPLALLSNSKSPEHTAPITSLDWNIVQPSLIITSSIDTTCTIWDIPTLTAKTQLIAHDKEVFDVRFCANSVDVFVSCGADGSVRMFDLRSLEHSTIIYEPSDKSEKALSPDALSSSPTRGGGANSHSLAFPPPLLRIAASPHDAHLLATFSQDSNIIRVLDVRQPGQALLELKGHGASVNCIEWSSTQRGVLASGGDDSCVMLWDLVSSATGGIPQPNATAGQSSQGQGQERGPSAVWDCAFEVGNLSWSPVNGMLGVCGGRGLWGVSM